MGLYQISMSFVYVLISIACSGIPFVLGKKVAEYSALKDYKSLNASVSAALTIAVIVSSILTVLFVIFKSAVDSMLLTSGSVQVTLYLIPSIFALSVYACMRGALWGSKKFVTHSLLKLFDQFVRIAIGLILLSTATDSISGANMAALSFTITAFATMAVSLIIYFYNGYRLTNPKNFFSPIIVSIIPVGGIRVAGNLYQSLIAVIFPLRLALLTNISNISAIAQYGILSGMVLPMIALPTIFVSAISTAVMPEISSSMKTNNTERVRRVLTQAYNYSLLFGGLAIGLYLAFGAKLGTLIYNNEQAGFYVQASCWIMLPLSISALTTSMLNSLGLEYKSLVNYLISAVIIILIIWFTPLYLGSYSLIIGMGLGMTIAAVLNTVQIIKKVNLKAHLIKTTSLIIVFTAISGMLSLFIDNLLSEIVSQTLSLIICSVLCLASYLTLTRTYNIGNVNQLLTTFRKHKK